MNLFKALVFSLLYAPAAFAADSLSVEQKKLLIGINISPTYSYRTLVVAVRNRATTYVSENRDKSEIPMTAFSAGINAEYRINRSLGLSIGLSYSKQGYKTIPAEMANDVSGAASPGKVSGRYNYHYTMIPVELNFRAGEKRLQFIASAGIAPSFMLMEQTSYFYDYYDGHTEKYTSAPNYIYNPFNLYAVAGAGVDIHSGKTGIKIQPEYSYGLFRTKNADISEHLWNVGLALDGYFRF